jgi:pimeloyl-[acyl-carrier protein] methyl ester esterase
MSLYVQSFGTGPDIILLHGWGLHGGIWSATENNLMRHLAQRYRVTAIDLPGHGYSDYGNDGFTLTSATTAIAESIPAQAIVIGWSLGGLLALNLALTRPDLVHRLVLISSTARFHHAPDWQAAMTTSALRGFATALKENQRDTVLRFLALQVHGSSNERQQLRLLKQAIVARPPARHAALSSGLTILEQTDLRSRLGSITQPAMLLYGQHDRIVPPGTGAAMEALLTRSTHHILAGTGHAPFLSDPESTLHLLDEFLND